jgi:glycosyltransferase involved in cell wall biosynthesis
MRSDRALRIAQVAPLAESVPPRLYGGTERVIAWLTDELLELGHGVTLFASGDSVTRATLVPVWPRSLRLGRPRSDPNAALAALLDMVAYHADDFDVIHCHIDWVHLPLLERLSVPFLTTTHGRLDLPGLPAVARRFPRAPFVSISDNQRTVLAEANWLGTVYHGLPSDSLRPRYDSGGYLAFLGRLTPEKGPHVAIRLAHAANLPLRIAAKVPRGERGYFKEQLEPLIDGEQIQLAGEIDDRGKQDFLSNAAALLFPIDWPEPFGLVMIEAMACGTPVIAYRRGSVSEVVEDGVTGFIVDDEQAALQAINRLPATGSAPRPCGIRASVHRAPHGGGLRPALPDARGQVGEAGRSRERGGRGKIVNTINYVAIPRFVMMGSGGRISLAAPGKWGLLPAMYQRGGMTRYQIATASF